MILRLINSPLNWQLDDTNIVNDLNQRLLNDETNFDYHSKYRSFTSCFSIFFSLSSSLLRLLAFRIAYTLLSNSASLIFSFGRTVANEYNYLLRLAVEVASRSQPFCTLLFEEAIDMPEATLFLFWLVLIVIRKNGLWVMEPVSLLNCVNLPII